MNKVVVFTALFIQASSSLLRQAPGSRQTPCESLWKNMRVYHLPVARKLYKQVSKRGRCFRADCRITLGTGGSPWFQTSTTTEMLLSPYCSFSFHCILVCWIPAPRRSSSENAGAVSTGKQGKEPASQSLLGKEWSVLYSRWSWPSLTRKS